MSFEKSEKDAQIDKAHANTFYLVKKSWQSVQYILK